jgi:hypothetical protein
MITEINITMATVVNGEPASSVSHYGLDGRGSIPDRGRGFFL